MNSPTAASSQGLMSRIREVTAKCHEELEDWIAIDRRFATTAGYQDYLQQILPLFRGYENSLARLDWRGVGFQFEPRRKVTFIEQDLNFFGMVPSPGEISFPPPATLAAGFGSLYVLEGSTLGGRMILERLEQKGIRADSGAAFFNCYGENTTAMWKSFKEEATAYCSDDERLNEACGAAVATFDHYRRNIRPL